MNEENNMQEQYKFDPLSSINAFELARILAMLDLRLNKNAAFDQMPVELRQHFQKIVVMNNEENKE